MADADADEEVCLVYDINDSYTSYVQIFLAAFALASLYVKRLNEVPRRKLLTWWFDVSKQAFGACYGHVLNMVVAYIIAENVRGDLDLKDQCAWYAVNFLIDVTLGLLLAVLGLQLLDQLANKYNIEALKNSGVYIGPDAVKHWLAQLFAWLLILTVVKVILCFFLWMVSSPLASVAAVLFKPLQNNIKLELFFVMIVLPGVVNVVYFWITDHFLKAKSENKDAHEDIEGHQSRTEALIDSAEEAPAQQVV